MTQRLACRNAAVGVDTLAREPSRTGLFQRSSQLSYIDGYADGGNRTRVLWINRRNPGLRNGRGVDG
ncbi:MAG: hypothetical protein GY925_13965 [Actinomycetia bacterium]|nr:hypothetical protein [Actinomycetes bacterium]